MRIAFANRSSLLAGGAEQYLQLAARVLVSAGHEVGLWLESQSSIGAQIEMPPSAQRWLANEKDPFKSLRDWRPDVVYCNGLDNPRFEAELRHIAPSVYSAHAYVGTCISGGKMHAFPTPTPCSRVFGPACLALYLPRRCGGRNPITMLSRYQLEVGRLATIRKYRVVVVHSHHMKTEYARHGIQAELVQLPVPAAGPRALPLAEGEAAHLLFLGRMNEMKGGMILIDAAAAVARSGRAIRLTFAGDGADRELWKARAIRAMQTASNLRVSFEPWIDAARRAELLATSQALVVPSCWPEPFGMVGLEAAAFGVPSVAFAVGGIVDWLEDGVNGHLASATPPNASSLADAIRRCIQSPTVHARLADGAVAVHARFAARSFNRDLLTVIVKAKTDVSGLHNLELKR